MTLLQATLYIYLIRGLIICALAVQCIARSSVCCLAEKASRNIDLAEDSGFYLSPRAVCGSRCLTQLRALRLCVSPTLLRESSLQSAGNISPCILYIKVSVWMQQPIEKKTTSLKISIPLALQGPFTANVWFYLPSFCNFREKNT